MHEHPTLILSPGWPLESDSTSKAQHRSHITFLLTCHNPQPAHSCFTGRCTVS